MQSVQISFDEENKIRVLDSEKFKQTKETQEVAAAFAQSAWRRPAAPC